MRALEFPGGKRFAFTILDDTDVATVDNVRPMYRLLERLGMRTTKTVWPLACPEGSPNFGTSETLEDSEYLAFVRDLDRRGFELTWHGATMESSRRDRTLAGLERFHELIGHYPRIHANHAENRENLYWGAGRIDLPLLKFLFGLLAHPADYFLGDRESSSYWWGDLCARHIVYARNLTFNRLNVASINPSMPYHDPSRPLVHGWFSASDAEDATAFASLLHPRNQRALEDEGGFSIVATHFGKGYVRNSSVQPLVEERLHMLARRPGWFPTAGELLDWLREHRESETLPADEWLRMQWCWARDLFLRHWKRRFAWRRR
ncbi:MAG TPA: hypothetical protein VNJ52_11060 [Patescibacteria group bacterium]|nr:hypothetical protein [Patescibacteria group bacterium]